MQALELVGMQKICDSLWWRMFGCCSYPVLAFKEKKNPILPVYFFSALCGSFPQLGETVFFSDEKPCA